MRATIFLAATVLAACGPQMVGSKYVATSAIPASSGGSLTVTAADSTTLKGLILTVPAGALDANTTLTVELGSTLVTSGSAGPSALFGPSGLIFRKAARLTMPLTLAGSDTRGLFIQGQEDDGSRFTVAHSGLTIDNAAHTVSFDILSFTTFQPGLGAECAADSDCAARESCQNGACVAQACTSDSQCASGQVCASGACVACAGQACQQQPDAGMSCNVDSDCGTNFSCVRNTCVSTVVQPDGGQTCNVDSDCGTNFSCVRNTCIPNDTNDGGQPDAGLLCTVDTDCPTGEACRNAECVGGNTTDGGDPDGGNNICIQDSDCVNGDVCINGGCFEAIDGGQGPSDGGTQTQQRCLVDGDCTQPGQVCVANICMSP